jgi:hypothetical protein
MFGVVCVQTYLPPLHCREQALYLTVKDGAATFPRVIFIIIKSTQTLKHTPPATLPQTVNLAVLEKQSFAETTLMSSTVIP